MQPLRILRAVGIVLFLLSCAVATGYGAFQVWTGQVQTVWLIGLAVGYCIRMWGITVGYHRLATHPSFKTYWWIRLLLYIAGSTAAQGRLRKWVVDHLWHHAHPDQPHDLSSPWYIGANSVSWIKGLPHAFVLWILRPSPYPDGPRRMAEVCKKDLVLAFVDRTDFVWVVLPVFISLAVGGWDMALWANPICLFFTYMGTWSVNSFGHMGKRKQTGTQDCSRNAWWVGGGISGEGFHANHHAHPIASNLGWKPWEILFDTGTWVIWILEKLKLAWDTHWEPANSSRLVSG